MLLPRKAFANHFTGAYIQLDDKAGVGKVGFGNTYTTTNGTCNSCMNSFFAAMAPLGFNKCDQS